MTPTDVEAAILAAMTGSVPKAERKLRQATLQEEAAARAQMADDLPLVFHPAAIGAGS